jgi:hypothetical protein
MDELYPVYATAGLIVAYFLVQVAVRRFDPFAPVWLFLVGFMQVYVVQALSYHEWAIGVRGTELVAASNLRALWALVWFLFVYQLGLGRKFAALLPAPPRAWSPAVVAAISPPLVIWGLFCAGLLIARGDVADETTRTSDSVFRSFPFVMMVAAVLLIVTGRTVYSPRPVLLPVGLTIASVYILIWMFNGKRSHSLIGVLATVCAFYIARIRRPSWPVLLGTGFAGALVVAIAIGWRENPNYARSFEGFTRFVSDFKVTSILESLNISRHEGDGEADTYETVEYGGFLLMMDTVPEKSVYDYGENYLRVFSTFIPRFIWPGKPFYGRAQWVSAWIVGSEMPRDEDFTGPAIGILGATQLNGGAIGTLIVLALIALLLRTSYEYFRLYPAVPWVQFWWSITYYNSWFMTVNDDPLVWFYYNWGFSTFPIVVLMWWSSKLGTPRIRSHQAAIAAV